MSEEILEIPELHLAISMDDKIFNCWDDEGNVIGEPYSYNDWLQMIRDTSGVNEQLMGRNERTD